VNGTVLCVDDDRSLCQILARALSEEGYEVHTAFDGDEALAVFQETAVDVVLLDLILPRRDGFAVMEAIRALDGPVAATPIIVLTGCTPTPAYRDRAAALGAAALLTKPVPLAKLVEVVASAAETAKHEFPVAVEVSERPPSVRRPSGAPQGSLERVPFPMLLHHLHGLRANGVLHLASGKKRKWIQLRDGHPVAVRSNLINECLGHYLVRAGSIEQADLDESREQMRCGRLQGEILVAMEILSEEEIALALRAQADEKLFEVFAWKQGDFRFEKNAVVSRANKIGARRSPASLILLGVRNRLSEEIIADFFRSRMDCLVVPGDSPYYRFQEIDLAPEHETLLRDLDGARRVAEIIADDSDQSLIRTLYALVATGLLELKREAEAEAGASPVALQRAARTTVTAEEEAERTSLTAMAKGFSAQTHFEILGIGPGSSESEIHQAFVTRAEDSHPDLYADSSDAVREVAEEVFAHISRAYETLRDGRSRSLYMLDMRRDQRAAEQAERGHRALEAASQFQRGEVQLASRAYEDALVNFGRALELNPDEGDYHTHYGWTLYLCHPSDSTILEEAMEHVRRGLKLASHADRAYLYMGRLFRAIGKPAAAERMFTRAVQIEPDCVEALRELRLINLRRERSKGLIRRMLRR